MSNFTFLPLVKKGKIHFTQLKKIYNSCIRGKHNNLRKLSN